MGKVKEKQLETAELTKNTTEQMIAIEVLKEDSEYLEKRVKFALESGYEVNSYMYVEVKFLINLVNTIKLLK